MLIAHAIAVAAPQHAGLGDVLTWGHSHALPPGTLVRVPLGARTVLGVVWASDVAQEDGLALKPVVEALALPPLAQAWRDLVAFAARYYQRGLGELALAVLPPELRKLDGSALARRARRKPLHTAPDEVGGERPEPNAEQAAALAAIAAASAEPQPPCLLLHGVTGSGKTEVYLRAAEAALAAGRQVLVLVPEINLTPQLEARFAARFGRQRLVALHSALTPARRLAHWLAALEGRADVVLGTRLAVFTPLSRLGLIVVDEEHDPSYKQQDGARYSARDLAVYRGHLAGVPVVLGSATPSLESWRLAQQGRYRLLTLRARVGAAALPTVRVVDMMRDTRLAGQPPSVLSPPLIAAVTQRLARGEQSLLFLNRRGYAPVLQCGACGWKSDCPHCSAWRVFHKADRSLRCHHCGYSVRVPRACPDCGNLDIHPVGRGTEQLEEQVAAQWPAARVARIDADSTRRVGSLEAQLAAVHAGEVDILVGTQMVTKGHDFRRMTLVAAVNPDGALYSEDFRGPERLFATLMQAAGRAGRAGEGASEMWVQTASPAHALYRALAAHDYAAFAAAQLSERETAGLPPYAHLALLRVEAKTAAAAEGFARAARAAAQAWLDQSATTGVRLYPPLPPAVARVAGLERRQMLIEADSRAALQRLLAAWAPPLHALRRQAPTGVVARWALDVDPSVL